MLERLRAVPLALLLLAPGAVPSAGAEAVAAPRRVVTLAPSLTEIVFALGAGDRLVGVSSYCDYPEQAKSIDRVGTFLRPNLEVILAKRPDLVIAVPSPENRASVLKLEELGIRVRVVRPERIDEVLDAIETIGSDLAREEEARALTSRIRSGLASWRARLAEVEPRRVLMVVGRRPLIAAGAGTYQDELIGLAGGVNVAAQSGEAWPHLSMEIVIAAAPEVIIDTGMDAGEAAESAAFWTPYQSIPAVRDGRVVGAGRYDLLRPGPRILATLGLVVKMVHPEIGARAVEPVH